MIGKLFKIKDNSYFERLKKFLGLHKKSGAYAEWSNWIIQC